MVGLTNAERQKRWRERRNKAAARTKALEKQVEELKAELKALRAKRRKGKP